MGTAAGMLTEFRRLLGMAEHPPGSNRNPVVTWYNANIMRIGAGPWCNMAVTYAAAHSGNLGAILAGKGVGYAYTVWHAQKFLREGRWHYGVAGIKAGDVVFFDWGGRRDIGAIDHVGIVEKVSGGIYYTIEGNKGDRCVRVARDGKYIVGYGRPKYVAAAAKPSPDPAKPATIHAPSGYPLLRRGSSGTRVRQMQRALVKAGKRLPRFGADGDFGAETVKALKSFQRENRCAADGVYGPKTARALKEAVG
jgi:hypothetical protein